MTSDDHTDPAEEPLLVTRRSMADTAIHRDHARPPRTPSRLLKLLGLVFPTLLLIALFLFVGARLYIRHSLTAALPQIDGTLSLPGLGGPVSVLRDVHGVPTLRAASLDDLILAQGFITAQDRLWQMETLRRHASGELAAILGSSLIEHDRDQRLLQVRAAANRALAVLPADQKHWLDLYAQGVNASIAVQRAHSLPIEFLLLRFTPEPWTPRDSILVGLAMFQDLTTTFPTELSREAISAKLSPELAADLYPTGSWRDHPPVEPAIDLTAPQPTFVGVPLDRSQSSLTTPAHLRDLLHAQHDLPGLSPRCDACAAGSNQWAVAGSRTASGKPLLSNDMHLSHSVPGIWYQAGLQAPSPAGDFHVTGVTLPGVPFVIVGHNARLAWGFTNLGANVQDLYLEHLRGSGSSAEFQSPDGTWHPVQHTTEVIHVRGGLDITLDVMSTQHGDTPTPIVSPMFKDEKRPLALRWTIYDPANITASFYPINAAQDWTSFLAAFSTFGGPAQNVVYADIDGHIGYHATGHIPVRGTVLQHTTLSPIPTDSATALNDWTGYIPFDQLPSAFDPPGGVLATANARVTPDKYPFPVTLDWASPYRNERIWKVLTARGHLTSADMLALQNDVYSDLDHVVAQRLAYAIDHSTRHSHDPVKQRRLHQAADLLRAWNGNVDTAPAAPAIVTAARAALWPLILIPKLGDTWEIYSWGEKAFAEEQIIMHTPARWLPPAFASWDDLLAAAVDKGLTDSHAPLDLTSWHEGTVHPVDIEHPILSRSNLIRRLVGLPVGTGVQPQSGNTTTVKQVNRTFGPSERFTADLADLDHSTLNLVLGQSGNPASPWFLDQFPAWLSASTFPLPFTPQAVDAATTHTLTLTPSH